VSTDDYNRNLQLKVQRLILLAESAPKYTGLKLSEGCVIPDHLVRLLNTTYPTVEALRRAVVTASNTDGSNASWPACSPPSLDHRSAKVLVAHPPSSTVFREAAGC
jgi:hypothetical protein